MNLSFSVVIPVRNGSTYIKTAIESILNQSYPVHSLFILENYSTDNTLQCIQTFQDPRIHIVPSNQSLTIEANWDRIKALPLAEYMTFMGHDDILYPSFLEEIVSLIQQHPHARLFQTRQDFIDDQGNLLRRCQPVPFQETASEFIERVYLEREDVLGAGYVMRSNDYVKVGGIPTLPNLLYADVILWYRLTLLGYKVCSPLYLTGFRLHQQNTHRLSNLEVYYQACLQYLEFLETTDYFQRNGLSLARSYVSDYFRRERCNFLSSIIKANDQQFLAQGLELEQIVTNQARQNHKLDPDDFKTTLYRTIASIPNTSFRQLVYRMFQIISRIRIRR
jgi:glycosyltransferase involved in cell wall biosynthesis